MSAEEIVFSFRLYVVGHTARSELAVASLKAICNEHLRGHYELEIVDVLERPDLAEAERILATPTVIRLAPLPLRRAIGDLSNHEHAAIALGIPTSGRPTTERQEP